VTKLGFKNRFKVGLVAPQLAFAENNVVTQFGNGIGINHKQSTRWQHLSRLEASAFFSLQNFFSCYETQQLILGTGTAIWWVTEPHWVLMKLTLISPVQC
jgi:hypothetical protein